jgi:hypothetical protein
MRTALLLVVLSWSCTRGAPSELVDAGLPAPAPEQEDGGVVTTAHLDAWLAYQAHLAEPLRGVDAGRGELVRLRARQEQAARADAGLSLAQVDALEEAIAAFVTQRHLAALTGADAVKELERSVAALPAAQQAKAQAALSELKGQAQRADSLESLEVSLGRDAVAALLTRESILTKTWDALVEARGDKR